MGYGSWFMSIFLGRVGTCWNPEPGEMQTSYYNKDHVVWRWTPAQPSFAGWPYFLAWTRDLIFVVDMWEWQTIIHTFSWHMTKWLVAVNFAYFHDISMTSTAVLSNCGWIQHSALGVSAEDPRWVVEDLDQRGDKSEISPTNLGRCSFWKTTFGMIRMIRAFFNGHCNQSA